MSVRKRRKKDKQRGMRTHGKGNTKNSRGAGSRGGRGRAGSHKHKYSKYYADFGGKKAMKPAKKGKAINLSELENLVEVLVSRKKAEERDGKIFIDGKKAGISKILSRGIIKKRLVLKNIKASRKATEKIVKAGGTIAESIQAKNQGGKDAGVVKTNERNEAKSQEGSSVQSGEKQGEAAE